MSFIHDDFLLSTKAARRLFHEFAESEPVLDYHNHLPSADIARDRTFANLWEIWLEGDHYKWRAMRTNGVAERYCTGDAEPYEKFLAWARTVPRTLRNPLYHWTHLELRRYFGIEELLDEKSAPAIWERANEQLSGGSLGVHAILRQFKVKALCTTDDPADSLEHHRAAAASGLETGVFPCFRPDKALAMHDAAGWRTWIARLGAAAGCSIGTWDDFLSALKQRHDDFHEMGCRLTDHGLGVAFAKFGGEADGARIFQRAIEGEAVDESDCARFATEVLLHVARWNAKRGWTMQFHLGALRNNNSRRMRELGPDTGFDSIGDFPQLGPLAAFLDRLDAEDALPRTVLYNLNPADNYAFATLIGCFQDERIAGKIQLGSGWWFLDQKEGMEWQLNAISNLGLLSRFIGMVTDSRSFMSFPRHEYFRRVLCNLLGGEMERGEVPGDFAMVGGMVRDICFGNARDYLRLPLVSAKGDSPASVSA